MKEDDLTIPNPIYNAVATIATTKEAAIIEHNTTHLFESLKMELGYVVLLLMFLGGFPLFSTLWYRCLYLYTVYITYNLYSVWLFCGNAGVWNFILVGAFENVTKKTETLLLENYTGKKQTSSDVDVSLLIWNMVIVHI